MIEELSLLFFSNGKVEILQALLSSQTQKARLSESCSFCLSCSPSDQSVENFRRKTAAFSSGGGPSSSFLLLPFSAPLFPHSCSNKEEKKSASGMGEERGASNSHILLSHMQNQNLRIRWSVDIDYIGRCIR